MNCRSRKAFTLVELLVVITIIGMLMALLLPAVQAARESARKCQCMNNQKQVSLASLNFEAVNGEFPGYRNDLWPADPPNSTASWVVMLFPYLERNKVWDAWVDDDPNASPAPPAIYMKILLCPSDPLEQINPGSAPCSYICNTQLMRDCDGVSIDFISRKDGVCTTLMISERILPGGTLGVREWKTLDPAEVDVGFQGVGTMRDELTSRHGNGVIVAYCDGHIRFLRNDISDATYQKLCGPDDGIVDESDFE